MAKDNGTGKDKEFYDLGKKMFDRIQPLKPDTQAVLVEEMQRMAKRIEGLETEQDCVGWFGYDTALRLWFETNKGDGGAIPLYKARGTT